LTFYFFSCSFQVFTFLLLPLPLSESFLFPARTLSDLLFKLLRTLPLHSDHSVFPFPLDPFAPSDMNSPLISRNRHPLTLYQNSNPPPIILSVRRPSPSSNFCILRKRPPCLSLLCTLHRVAVCGLLLAFPPILSSNPFALTVSHSGPAEFSNF